MSARHRQVKRAVVTWVQNVLMNCRKDRQRYNERHGEGPSPNHFTTDDLPLGLFWQRAPAAVKADVWRPLHHLSDVLDRVKHADRKIWSVKRTLDRRK
jgi:hypothetical protein